ncbi:MAG: DUF4920 domain-containing protein [Phycisphaerales bacterium]|nr:DUF4920 domain-containing protein [Phycisphaerales bacterium]
MKRVLISLVTLAAMTGCAAQHAEFGERPTARAAETLSVAKVLDNPKAYEGKVVRVSGVVSDVCKPKGCWMELSDPGSDGALFVKFTCPVEGRLIPLEAVDHKATAQGKLVIEQVGVDELRHMAEDAGKSPADIAKITQPEQRLRFESAYAEVEGVESGQK